MPRHSLYSDMLPCTEEEGWSYSHQPGLPVTPSQPGPPGVVYVNINHYLQCGIWGWLTETLVAWSTIKSLETPALGPSDPDVKCCQYLMIQPQTDEKVLNRVQNEGSVYQKCLLIPKALFHHNWFIVEEEEGAWNRVFWALRCQVLSRHSWHLWMLLVRSNKVPLSPHHGLEYSCNRNMCQSNARAFNY